jgi:hypothetical protein
VRTGVVGIIHRGRPTSSSDQKASQRAMASLYTGSLVMGTTASLMEDPLPEKRRYVDILATEGDYAPWLALTPVPNGWDRKGRRG